MQSIANRAAPYFTAIVLAVVLLTGCGKPPEVAVIDLDAVAKAVGRDDVFKQQMQAAREKIGQQLSQHAATLKVQLEKTPGEAAAADARRQWQKAMGLAEQRAREYQLGLVREFREQLRPVVEKIAKEHGAKTVISATQDAVWFAPEVDLTSEVIAKLRAEPLPVSRPTQGQKEMDKSSQTTSEAKPSGE